MIDRATLLLAMPGFRVLNVTTEPDGGRLVLMESVAPDGGCPSCRLPYESGRWSAFRRPERRLWMLGGFRLTLVGRGARWWRPGRSLVANIWSSHQEEVRRGAEFVDLLLTGKQRDVAAPVRVTKYLW